MFNQRKQLPQKLAVHKETAISTYKQWPDTTNENAFILHCSSLNKLIKLLIQIYMDPRFFYYLVCSYFL